MHDVHGIVNLWKMIQTIVHMALLEDFHIVVLR